MNELKPSASDLVSWLDRLAAQYAVGGERFGLAERRDELSGRFRMLADMLRAMPSADDLRTLAMHLTGVDAPPIREDKAEAVAEWLVAMAGRMEVPR